MYTSLGIDTKTEISYYYDSKIDMIEDRNIKNWEMLIGCLF